jgi:hypothetical protein
MHDEVVPRHVRQRPLSAMSARIISLDIGCIVGDNRADNAI